VELVFATHNPHKLCEIKSIVEAERNITISGLTEIGFLEDIIEDAETLEGNASKKAWTVYKKTGKNCFADDTGLEVEALNGRPGVHSARYAGESCNFDDNINKLLQELGENTNRTAHFRTVISLIINGFEYLFEGKISGVIMSERRGSNGFSYDPVFRPNGYTITFGEMTEGQKNAVSHRALATEQMLKFLDNSQEK